MSWRAAATLALIAWGSLAFGAVYSWAYVPLFAGCAVLGVAAALRRTTLGHPDWSLAVSLAVVIAAIGIQLIPVSNGTIKRVSAETDGFLARYQVGYSAAGQRHPLSIQPRATALALAATCALTFLLLGLARGLNHGDTRQIVRGVTALGAVLAVIGIVQAALWNGRIYGVWTPMQAGLSFGPFVNRNHFAGWMLMATPLAAGYLCGRVAHGMRQVKPGWRHHLLWLSSGEASETILVGAAVLLMTLSVALTTSRSGVLGLLAALLITGWFVARRQISMSRRAIVATYLVVVLLAAAAFGRVDRLAARFADADAATFGNRAGIWSDTWRIAGQFPFAGTGLNTYGVSTLFYQTVDLDKHVTAAHNDYLELLAEGGALVCLPVAFVILTVVWTVRCRFRDAPHDTTEYWIRIGAVTGVVAIALQEAGDFSLQIPGNAVLFAVLLALAVRPAMPSRRTVKRTVTDQRHGTILTPARSF